MWYFFLFCFHNSHINIKVACPLLLLCLMVQELELLEPHAHTHTHTCTYSWSLAQFYLLPSVKCHHFVVWISWVFKDWQQHKAIRGRQSDALCSHIQEECCSIGSSIPHFIYSGLCGPCGCVTLFTAVSFQYYLRQYHIHFKDRKIETMSVLLDSVWAK